MIRHETSAPAPGRDQKPLISLLVITIVATIVSWAAVRQAENSLIGREAMGSAVKWTRFVRDSLTDLDGLLSGDPISENDRRVFEFASKAGGVIRYKVFGPSGLIVFASRLSDIGKASTKPYFSDVVKAGGTYVEIEDNEDFGVSRSVVSEAYVPIMARDRFRGAIEVYVDMSAPAIALRQTGNIVLAGLLFILGIVGGICGMFVRRATLDRDRELQEVIESREIIRMAEALVREAKEDAELANRAKTEFLTNMSHELRTPLNAVIGFSDVIRNQTFGPIGSPKYLEYVADINGAGVHLLGLINDILDLSKVEASKLELFEQDVDVVDIVGSCLTLIKERAAAAGVQIEQDIPSSLPSLWADERKLKQILINLLSNAVKFTLTGGRVTVRASFGQVEGYVLQIADTGIGIATEDIPKALAHFGQIDGDLSRKFDGTGLGLPLTKALVELHGGIFHLESAIGVGTTATIRFPVERFASQVTATL